MFLDMENLSSIKFKGVIRGCSNRETPIIINPSPTANTRDHVDYTPPPLIKTSQVRGRSIRQTLKPNPSPMANGHSYQFRSPPPMIMK
ncbi:hypothetical protein MTR67_053748 [Solanum verrucosum]|uniref:Uncharacterized protein n=1 Tax=Solanum verrucosum TaxID=315347 RepID=A0AAF1A3W5_SOLVR|nr:hypothetical protein MTR67_053748 [Solanum verrucosum]